MKAMLRFLLGTLTTLLAITTFALPDLTPPECLDTPGERENREQRLRGMMEVGAERIGAVDELLSGKRTLRQTALRFRDLALEDPLDVMELLRLCHPADCDESELFYRQVLYYTSTRIRSLELSERRIQALEAEFESLRAAGQLTLDETARGL